MPIVTHKEADDWWNNLIAAGKAVDNDAKYPVLALAAALTQCCADAKDAWPSRLYPEERSWGHVQDGLERALAQQQGDHHGT